MHRHLQRLKKYVHSPYTEFATGLILLVSGLASAYYDFVDADHTMRLGVHHGVILWSLVQVFGSLPDFIDGLERSVEAIEKDYGS